MDIYEKTVPFRAEKPSDIRAAVYAGGKLLVEYQPKEEGIPETAKPAEAAKDPEEIMTNEELFLTGQHIEQYPPRDVPPRPVLSGRSEAG